MREEILRLFFESKATAEELSADIAGSTTRVNDVVSYVSIEEMDGELRIVRPMLIALCDAVVSGKLPPESLHEIGFALAASDHFFWDAAEDELVSDVINDWSCPEVNYPLTVENVKRFRSWLLDMEPYPARPSSMAIHEGKLISLWEKKSIERHKRKQTN